MKRKLLNHFTWLILLASACTSEDVEPAFTCDINWSLLRVYGDIDGFNCPLELRRNLDSYAQIPVEAINLFKHEISELEKQSESEYLVNANKLDTMVIAKSVAHSKASCFESYSWLEPGQNVLVDKYFQTTKTDTAYFFDYWWQYIIWGDGTHAWQSLDGREGHITTYYWINNVVTCDWKKTKTKVSFSAHDHGYYPWEGIRYDGEIDTNDLSGYVIQSHFDGWSVRVEWNAKGQGNWVHSYEDGTKKEGTFN